MYAQDASHDDGKRCGHREGKERRKLKNSVHSHPEEVGLHDSWEDVKYMSGELGGGGGPSFVSRVLRVASFALLRVKPLVRLSRLLIYQQSH